MKKTLILISVLLVILSSCDSSNGLGEVSSFEMITQLAGKNIKTIQFNSSDELLLGCLGDSIYLYNFNNNRLTSLLDYKKLWNFSKNKCAIGSSIILSYYRNSLQIYKSSDDGKSWSQLLINDLNPNTTDPVISGDYFFLKDNSLKLIYILDKNFNLSYEINSGTADFKSVYPWFDGKILINKSVNSVEKWFLYDYSTKTETETEFNLDGKLTKLLLSGGSWLVGFDIYSSKIYKSTDLGKSFVEISNKPCTTIHDIKVINSILYIATDKGLFSSSDLGTTWNAVFTSSEEPDSFDMNSKGKLYVVTDANKVYREK